MAQVLSFLIVVSGTREAFDHFVAVQETPNKGSLQTIGIRRRPANVHKIWATIWGRGKRMAEENVPENAPCRQFGRGLVSTSLEIS